jgi:hypothetical protein
MELITVGQVLVSIHFLAEQPSCGALAWLTHITTLFGSFFGEDILLALLNPPNCLEDL